VAVAIDPDTLRKSGTYQVVGELAEEYGLTDVDGKIHQTFAVSSF
jgi:hypothetical protein